MNSKRFLQNRKIITLVAAVITVIGVGVGGTYAFLTSATADLVNTFTVGSVETEIVEVLGDLKKEPRVLNTGKSDCIIRMRVEVSPTDTGIALNYDTKNWEYNDDGFYYYKGIVAPGEQTTALFTTITLPAAWYQTDGSIDAEKFISFDISLYQEAVQASVNIENGGTIKAYTEENGKKRYHKENAAMIYSNYDAASKSEG